MAKSHPDGAASLRARRSVGVDLEMFLQTLGTAALTRIHWFGVGCSLQRD
jgi:hypothetical protein